MSDLLEIYKDITTNIRTTDETSFKLLGLVPLGSGIGAGALTLMKELDALGRYPDAAMAGFSLVGALITFGLFRWELRNIQKCNWFISRAARLEKHILREEPYLQFRGMAREEDV